MEKIKKYGLGLFAMVLSVGLLCVGTYVSAAETASSTLTTIMDTIISTSVGFAVLIITQYWPYVLVFGILSAMIGLFAKFAHLGSGRK